MSARPRVPPYARIAADLRARIASGDLQPGDRVPPTRDLARTSRVALATATKALAVLKQEGVVRALPRVGVVVAGGASTTGDRGERGGLRREAIVRAAIDIADREGFDAVSMRSIAAKLEVPPMSLYRRVRDRDELLLWMADATFHEAALPADPPPGWRARVELMMRLQWSLYRKHPWLARLLSVTRPQLVPSGMAHTEWGLRAVDGLGLSTSEMIHVHVTAMNFVRGIAVHLESEAQAEADTGMTAGEWIDEHDRAFADAFREGAFPMLSRVAAEPAIALDLESLFEFGTARLLDGLEAFFARATPPLHAVPTRP